MVQVTRRPPDEVRLLGLPWVTLSMCRRTKALRFAQVRLTLHRYSTDGSNRPLFVQGCRPHPSVRNTTPAIISPYQ
jgi:hypothetical protein